MTLRGELYSAAMNVNSTVYKQPVRSPRGTPKRVLKGEEAKLARYKKWLKHRQQDVEHKVIDQLWLLGHTFDQQPKETFK
jgi:hypothetical protein